MIDIGNTRTKVLRMEQSRVVESITLDYCAQEIEAMARGCKAAIVSSVAAAVDVRLDIPVLHLNPSTPLPIGVEYGSRHTLGADRVAAAVGAWRCCPHQPCLIIDSGTCITIDLVIPGRGFVGGNISAGIDMRLRACHEFTGRLPQVERGVMLAGVDELRDTNGGDIPVLGNDTDSALLRGALLGVKHELEGYVRLFSAKYDNLAVIITGGATFRFDVPEKVTTFVRPYLVAEGLEAILEYNMSKKCNSER